MKAKKLLAILLSLAVLIGLVPMAGMLANAADTTEATNTVFTVDFAKAGDTFVPYNGTLTDIGGNLSLGEQVEFYYCLVGADVNLGWGDGDQTVSGVGGSASNNLVIKAGTYDNTDTDGGYIVKTTCTVNKMCPTFTATGPAKLYIWNLRFVKLGGDWKTVYRDMNNYDKATTTATVAQGNAASTYDWSAIIAEGYESADPEVYEVTFKDAGETLAILTYQTGWGISKGADASFSFKYLLVGAEVKATTNTIDDNNKVMGWALGDDCTYVSGDTSIAPGEGSFSLTVNCPGGKMGPTFTSTGPAKLYIWKTKRVIGGTETAFDVKDSFAANYGQPASTATISEKAPLSTFDKTAPEAPSPDVTELTFAAANDDVWLTSLYASWMGLSPDFFKESPAEYTFTFDYYLEGATVNVKHENPAQANDMCWPGGYQNYKEGDKVITPGKGSFSVVVTSHYDAEHNKGLQFRPYFKATGAAKLYIWNVTTEISGKTANYTAGDYDKTEGFTKATVEANGKLKEQAFIGKKISEVPAVTAPAGKEFDAWVGADGATIATDTVIAADTVFKATFKDAPTTGGEEGGEEGGETGGDKIIRINMSDYDWEENEYNANCGERILTNVTPKEGDEVKISFEYCIVNDGGKISVYNDWYYHNLVAGSYAFENNENKNYVMTAGKKGKAETSFTASAADARRPIDLSFEGNINDGVPADIYIWNFSIIINGVEQITSMEANVAAHPAASYGKYFSMVDVDPATLTPGKATADSGAADDDDFGGEDDGEPTNPGADNDADTDADGDGDADVDGDDDADDEGGAPNTGDAVADVAMAALVLALAGAVLIASKKRA